MYPVSSWILIHSTLTTKIAEYIQLSCALGGQSCVCQLYFKSPAPAPNRQRWQSTNQNRHPNRSCDLLSKECSGRHCASKQHELRADTLGKLPEQVLTWRLYQILLCRWLKIFTVKITLGLTQSAVVFFRRLISRALRKVWKAHWKELAKRVGKRRNREYFDITCRVWKKLRNTMKKADKIRQCRTWQAYTRNERWMKVITYDEDEDQGKISNKKGTRIYLLGHYNASKKQRQKTVVKKQC